jgi:DNA-binding SARP family transcriptional activator
MTAQRLLAFLALHDAAPRALITGTLWPDASEQRAQGNLRTTIWRMQRGAPMVIDAEGDMLRLRSQVSVDYRAFMDAAGHVLHDEALPDDCDQAIVLRAGDLLPGWYDDWVIFERERLRQLRLHVLDSLAERLASRRQFMRALEAAMTSAGIEPLRESAHRAIIAIHLAEQNLVEALRDYELFRNLLRAELGVEPSRQLTAMLPLTTMKTDR